MDNVVLENMTLRDKLTCMKEVWDLSAYYCQMTRPPETPLVSTNICYTWRFSVQLSERNLFGKMPVDHTTEGTVNKDTQTTGKQD